MTPQTKFDLWRERGDDPTRKIDAQWNERRHAEYWRNQMRRVDYERKKDAQMRIWMKKPRSHLFANNGAS